MKGHFVGQEIAPKYEPGVVHSGEGKVLLRWGKASIVWRSGGSFWSGGKDYCPAMLEIWSRRTRSDMSDTVFEGGRLTLKRIEKALPQIKEVLGLRGLTIEHFNLRKTYMVDEPVPMWCHHCGGPILEVDQPVSRWQSNACVCTNPIPRSWPPGEKAR